MPQSYIPERPREYSSRFVTSIIPLQNLFIQIQGLTAQIIGKDHHNSFRPAL